MHIATGLLDLVFVVSPDVELLPDYLSGLLEDKRAKKKH